MDQISREGRKPLDLAVGAPVLEGEVLILDVSEITLPLAKHLKERRRPGNHVKISDSRHLPGPLRLGGERRGEEAARQGAKEGPSIHHSIT